MNEAELVCDMLEVGAGTEETPREWPYVRTVIIRQNLT